MLEHTEAEVKYLKITIQRGSLGEDAMVYPTPYDPIEVDRNKQGPIVLEGAMRFGEATEEAVIYIADSVADAYAAASPNMEVITEEQADVWLQTARNLTERHIEERVVDPNRLLSIQVKQNAGVALSREDLQALDPDDLTPGINRRRKTAAAIFRER